MARFMPERLKNAARYVSSAFACSVCGLLVFASVKFLKDEISSGVVLFSMGSLEVHAAYMEWILPVGFALVLFHTFLSVFKRES